MSVLGKYYTVSTVVRNGGKKKSQLVSAETSEEVTGKGGHVNALKIQSIRQQSIWINLPWGRNTVPGTIHALLLLLCSLFMTRERDCHWENH